MKDQHKPQPESLDRPDPRAALSAAVQRAADGDADDDLTISFVVSGGVHEQHYEMIFATRGTVVEECRVDCELSDRHANADGKRNDPEVVAGLSDKLYRSGMFDLDAEPRLFLPDTVIGQITVQRGDTEHRILFAADPDQAAVQDAPPPKAVLEAADALYASAQVVLGIDSVRP